MSVKKCAREECGKTVYPIEELKCLDKVWHKQCFKCTVCGMTLSMKNYKGYDKKPYCEPHYPKTVASVVTDTPEMRRLAENTKFQSQIQYHADYEKMKGTKINVIDDPELTRHLQNSRIQSQAQYHGELEKKKLQDTNRPKEEFTNDPLPSSAELFNENFPPPTFIARKILPSSMTSSVSYQSSMATVLTDGNSAVGSGEMSKSLSYQNISTNQQNWYKKNSPYSQRIASQSGITVYSSDNGGRVPIQERQVGSIADYDPMNGNWGTTCQNTVSAQKSPTKVENTSLTKALPTQQPSWSLKAKGYTVKALYDYIATDTDEVSFLENDVIVNCEKVDDGWITGTVQRTLAWGMLPANYVERVNQLTGLYKIH